MSPRLLLALWAALPWAANGPGEATAPAPAAITSPAPGTSVGRRVRVEGNAEPGATVWIHGLTRRPRPVRCDGSGRFSVELRPSVPNGPATLGVGGATRVGAAIDVDVDVPKGLDVILSIGQSNVYFGFGFDPVLDAPHPRIHQYGRYDDHDRRVIRAREPLEHFNHPDGYVGHVLTFAKLVLPEISPERDLLIVPCAKGASAVLDFWSPGEIALPGDGGPGYEDAVERATEVLASDDNELFAILWQQGEADTVPVPNPDYQVQLDDMITALRLELGAPQVPFLLGGLVPYWVAFDPLPREPNAAIIADTPNRMAYTAYVDPTGLNPHRPSDARHYSASAQRGIAFDQERGLAGRYLAQLENARTNDLAPGLPDAPYSLRGTRREDGRTTLTWIRPWQRASALVDYDVELRPVGDPTWLPAGVLVAGDDVSAVVPGLANDTPYELRVRARNAVGEGPWATVEGVLPGTLAADADLLLHAGLEAGYLDTSANGSALDPFGNSLLVVDPERGLVQESSSDSFLLTSVVLRSGDSYTAAAWFRIGAAATPVGYLVAPDVPGVGNPFLRVELDGSQGRLVAGHGDEALEASSTLALERWYHAVFVYDHDAGAGRVYLDGVLSAEAPLPPVEVTADVVLGNSADLADEGFVGRLDDLRVFDRALSAAEVADLHALELMR